MMRATPQVSLIDDWLAPESAPLISGLRLLLDYIDSDVEAALSLEIDAQTWSVDWRRRMQVYGLGYGVGAARSALPLPLPLPPRVAELGRRLHRDGLIEHEPENAVVNEYVPGIGIAPHRDYRVFGPTVIGISLGAWCVMDLVDPATAVRIALPLPPRSALVIGGEARSRWKHGIAARRSDVIGGIRVPRARRLSVTYRTAAATVTGGEPVGRADRR